MSSSPTPLLAAPGAGLPKLELMIARWIFARHRKRHSREAIRRQFEEERGRIMDMAASCDPHVASTPVMIKRLRGLEDSSRNWSVYMTLEHLRIVNNAAEHVIRSLSMGVVPEGKASTAAVKPASGIGPEVLPAFHECCDAFLKTVAGVADLRTPSTYAHPWFGPLDAAGWHSMIAFHMRLHRVQVEEILRVQGRSA